MSLYTFIADTLGHLDVITLVPKALPLAKDFVVFAGYFLVVTWPGWMLLYMFSDLSYRGPTKENTRQVVKAAFLTCAMLFVLGKTCAFVVNQM